MWYLSKHSTNTELPRFSMFRAPSACFCFLVVGALDLRLSLSAFVFPAPGLLCSAAFGFGFPGPPTFVLCFVSRAPGLFQGPPNSALGRRLNTTPTTMATKQLCLKVCLVPTWAVVCPLPAFAGDIRASSVPSWSVAVCCPSTENGCLGMGCSTRHSWPPLQVTPT